MTRTSPARTLLEEAFASYQRGDLAGSERILQQIADDPGALHLMGLIRVRQARLPEAADLLARAVAGQPKQAQAHLNHGKVLAALGRHGEAARALEAAATLDPHNKDAHFRHAKALQASGNLPAARDAFGRSLALDPTNLQAGLLLGRLLLAMRQPAEAKAVLTQALGVAAEPGSLAELHQELASAEHEQGHELAALGHLEQALALDPARIRLELDRGQLLETLGRYDEAKQAYRRLLDQDPVSLPGHRLLNDLHHRLGEEDAFLQSYSMAPRTRELVLDKAELLLGAERSGDAELTFRGFLSRYGDDKRALTGLGIALMRAGRLAEAITVLEGAADAYPGSADILCNLSAAYAREGAPAKGAAMAARALALDPANQLALAMQGTCWRLLGDERDRLLNGYDRFIQVFDLDAPAGYRDMQDFNADLGRALEELHPATGEYLGQSLRGGTQTSNDLFSAGHPLIEKLRARIDGAIEQYISGICAAPDHPFTARKGRNYAFSGSWSSRLQSGGFHINHLHPGGWISSCYYVDVPAAMSGDSRQGWITFGQPSFDVGLEPLHAVRPVPGRLVLFPSYMWHGTVPFQAAGVRTTIAFDVVPAGAH